MSETDKPDRRFSRRNLIRSIALTTSASIAGCGSQSGEEGASGGNNGDNTGDNDLGERVPTVILSYFTDNAEVTAAAEQMIDSVQANISELGVNVELMPVTSQHWVDVTFNDKRDHHIGHARWSMANQNLDPTTFTWTFFSILSAGATGEPNWYNWANCEHTIPANDSLSTVGEERASHVNKAQEVISRELPFNALVQYSPRGAYRTDQVDIGGLGKAGVRQGSYSIFFESETTTGEPLRLANDPGTIQTPMVLNIQNPQAFDWWGNILYSPLTSYDENFKPVPVLAKDLPEQSNGGRKFTVELKDNLVFHNGDPLTAEDVKFTFEFVEQFASEFSNAQRMGYSSIEQVDETTVEFNFEEPAPIFPTRILPSGQGAIVPKNNWIESGAMENPTDFDIEPIVGSGPFKLVNFQQNQSAEFEPFEQHPTYVPNQGLISIGYDSLASAGLNDFKQGNVDILPNLGGSLAEVVRDEVDNAEVVIAEGFSQSGLCNQCTYGPTMFSEFRRAVSWSIDRQLVNQLAYNGENNISLYSTGGMSPTHPWWPGEDNLVKTADPTSNIERAKEELREEGWGWDDQGRLHYPADADLTPPWPKGDAARDYPEKYPCLRELPGWEGNQ